MRKVKDFYSATIIYMRKIAEEVRFELTRTFLLCGFSRAVPSTTRPLFLNILKKDLVDIILVRGEVRRFRPLSQSSLFASQILKTEQSVRLGFF